MSDQQTIDESEDCLLGRCGACPGDVLLTSTSLVAIRTPCLCFCHGLAK